VSRHHLVRVLPADAELLVDEEDDIFWAARSAGWQWPTTCAGSCECGQCYFRVVDGAEYLSPMTEAERDPPVRGHDGGQA